MPLLDAVVLMKVPNLNFRCYENVVRLQILDEIEAISTNVLRPEQAASATSQPSIEALETLFKYGLTELVSS